MPLTRRQAMAATAAMAAGAARLAAQSRGAGAMLPRVTPAVCLYSRVLIEIGQVDLPMVIGGLGFDGVDLSVEPGGHVPPEKAANYLMPALEGFTGRGIDVPMITTALTSLEDKDAENLLGLSSYIKVPFFRPGHWKFTGSPAIEMQLGLVQRQIAGLAQLARATNMAMGIHNFVDGAEGAAVPDIARVIRPIDPHLVGYCFDAGYATAQGGPNGFAAALELALPRLKMVAVRDFEWDREGGGVPRMVACPLGEGVVDWPKFFAALAKARFAGPVSLHIDYQPKAKTAAIRKDLAFLRQQIDAAYSSGK
ncbi:MAG: sugar phosphate isomerase/epimerase [Bryobacteraceae bacterium]